ncbi:MAG: asparagine synthase (glutamine-hydrolyzing) [Gammaproteobacteria bacterium]|nr:asparagine synthase (glutamine-hydrolyzing) [Gammaproteobacteria bacterium]
MTDSLAYGGPDDRGVWRDDAVALGHRRLAILDLSPLGHQPMLSPSSRYVIAFNGEIYNFKALRKILEAAGFMFKGHSDTEVILAGVECWGFEKTLQQLNGMFAIALWDREQKKLYLARDRFGEKPLYYGCVNGAFIFASELKALCLYPGFNKKMNMQAVQFLLRYAYIRAPLSIYENIFKLEPGHYLCVDQSLNIAPQAYWSATDVALQARRQGSELSFQEAVDELEVRLTDSVKSRCISDVPFGAFLSGGVDSSTIVALMQKSLPQAVKTFSIGFENSAYDEAPYAKAVAQHLGTEHHELYVTDQDALNVIPKLSQIYDEPFADSSQIPTYLVSQMAKQHVTVVLSGDAGDELFGGYQRYFFYHHLQKLHHLPFVLRQVLGAFAMHIPSHLIGQKRQLPFKKLAWMLRHSKQASSFYDTLISQNYLADQYLNQATPLFMACENSAVLSATEQVMLWDTISYLPDDILTKVDRASMAVALETRVPFLDHTLFEFLWTLPMEFKVQKNQGKVLLKELLYRYVPKKLVDRPKAGFGIPIHDWLRGPLKEWAGDLIASTVAGGILNQSALEAAFREHLSGRVNLGALLWNALIFQDWMLKNNGQ